MDKQWVFRETEIPATRDICGSAIDLVNAETAGSRNISIATILLDPGASSREHYHQRTEEIYYILDGHGEVTIDGQTHEVVPGVAIYLPIGSRHQLTNTGSIPLKLVSADSPSFDESDIFE